MGEFEIFSLRIKELRESLGMTQKDFSEHIGIKQQTLSGYERGIMKPPLDVTKDIAEKCNVSIDWLCGLSSKKQYSEELVTYGDMLRLIIKLTNANVMFDNYWEVIYSENSDNSNVFGEQFPEYATLRISDSEITNFFKEWQKMYELYRDDTIDMHLYTLWLNDKLKKYDTMPLTPSPDLEENN